jgi:NAD(P)-dependent dehydrogenase (short-subunit alcohol dehydrogenase family)
MSIDLSGKVVIVTGGAKGIGEGCVQKFLDSNATVVSLDLDDSALKSQESKYEKLESRFSTHLIDVSNEAQVAQSISKVQDTYGRIDGLINCAGIQTYGSVVDTTEEIWDKVYTQYIMGTSLEQKNNKRIADLYKKEFGKDISTIK